MRVPALRRWWLPWPWCRRLPLRVCFWIGRVFEGRRRPIGGLWSGADLPSRVASGSWNRAPDERSPVPGRRDRIVGLRVHHPDEWAVSPDESRAADRRGELAGGVSNSIGAGHGDGTLPVPNADRTSSDFRAESVRFLFVFAEPPTKLEPRQPPPMIRNGGFRGIGRPIDDRTPPNEVRGRPALGRGVETLPGPGLSSSGSADGTSRDRRT